MFELILLEPKKGHYKVYKIVKDKKKSKEAQAAAQKELDVINTENKAIVENANNRKLEKNLKQAETRARQRGGKVTVHETQEEYIDMDKN